MRDASCTLAVISSMPRDECTWRLASLLFQQKHVDLILADVASQVWSSPLSAFSREWQGTDTQAPVAVVRCVYDTVLCMTLC